MQPIQVPNGPFFGQVRTMKNKQQPEGLRERILVAGGRRSGESSGLLGARHPAGAPRWPEKELCVRYTKRSSDG
jgi:hypothetical protein